MLMTFYKNLQCDAKSGPPYLAPTLKGKKNSSKVLKVRTRKPNKPIGEIVKIMALINAKKVEHKVSLDVIDS
jgi:hypothetical protein